MTWFCNDYEHLEMSWGNANSNIKMKQMQKMLRLKKKTPIFFVIWSWWILVPESSTKLNIKVNNAIRYMNSEINRMEQQQHQSWVGYVTQSRSEDGYNTYYGLFGCFSKRLLQLHEITFGISVPIQLKVQRSTYTIIFCHNIEWDARFDSRKKSKSERQPGQKNWQGLGGFGGLE